MQKEDKTKIHAPLPTCLGTRNIQAEVGWVTRSGTVYSVAIQRQKLEDSSLV